MRAALNFCRLESSSIDVPSLSGVSLEGSLMEHLDEDLLIEIVRALIHIPATERTPLRLADATEQSVYNAMMLWSSCKFFHRFSYGRVVELRQEIYCRAAIVAGPVDWCSPHPCHAQFLLEQQSYQTLNSFVASCKHLVTHCASTHCQRARRCFNDLEQGKYGRISVAFDLCKLVAAARCADVAVIYTQLNIVATGPSSRDKIEYNFVVCSGAPGNSGRLAWRSQSELTIVARYPAPPDVLQITVSADGTKLLAIVQGEFGNMTEDVLVLDLHSGVARRMSEVRNLDFLQADWEVVNAWLHGDVLSEALFSVQLQMVASEAEMTAESNGVWLPNTHTRLLTMGVDKSENALVCRKLHEEHGERRILWMDCSERGDAIAIHRWSKLQNGFDYSIETSVFQPATSEAETIVEAARSTLTARFKPGDANELVLITKARHKYRSHMDACCYTRTALDHWVLTRAINLGPRIKCGGDFQSWNQSGHHPFAQNSYACFSPCGRFLVLIAGDRGGSDPDGEVPYSFMVGVDLHAHLISTSKLESARGFSLPQGYLPSCLCWSKSCVWIQTTRGVLHLKAP